MVARERLSGPLSGWGAVFAVVGVAGIALRVWAYRATMGTPHADEAVVGLMTRHALDGELTVFYWGQAYGGTQEVLLTMPLFVLFGSGWLALRIVPIALTAVATLLVWRVGRRTMGEPAAAVAAGVFWIWPALNVYQLVHQMGFYASNVVYCALLLLLALRLVERPDPVRAGLFGLVLGLAFWQTAQIVPLAAGVIVWTIWKQPRALRQVWLAGPLAVLGALPWIVWNASNGWESLKMPDYGDRTLSLRLLASPVLPMVTGLRAPLSAELLVPKALTFLIYVALLGLFVYGAVRTHHRNVWILYVVTAVFPFVYMLSPKTVYGAPRFLIVLTPVFALLLAQVATSFPRATALLALVFVVSVVNLYRMERWFDDVPGKTTHTKGVGPRHIAQWVPRDLSPLTETLDRLGLDHVYADYWLAFRLSFDTRERIIAAEHDLTGVRFDGEQAVPLPQEHTRSRSYEQAVERARHGFIFYEETIDTVAILPRLERYGYGRHPVATFVVYAPPGVGYGAAPPRALR